ncbi:helix-turn-helix domain-containing protein [Oceanobacillus oncorhynchi]|uniref:helix-turn-helix domain-containing protein n=1 Tax=Oceanobacillus oncorhynchi TaxID=545501 RepID=UPI0018691295|nr:helix-turn-helix transcriptional regulator [Oceanobacillus oncorhynchi]
MLWLKIEEIMKEKGLTQYKLAKRAGVGTNTITYLKSGKINKPSFELMCKIADALEISLDELRKEDTSCQNI